MELQEISSEANQDLVKNAEQFGQLLARTLNEEVPKTIKSKNNIGLYYWNSFICYSLNLIILVIKAQIKTTDDINKGDSLKFPDEDDIELINKNFHGLKAQVLIPNKLLHKALDAASKP